MDDIVKAALAKWPKVPHCYGWLSLDARGTWRMHDERAQALNLKGDPIRHGSLNDFINRNYGCDENGCWFFQNGPQRVYVDLEATPYIAHYIPESGWILHTKQKIENILHVYLSSVGKIFIDSEYALAQIDDRDLNYALSQLEKNGKALNEDDLLLWLTSTSQADVPFSIQMNIDQQQINVRCRELAELMQSKKYQSNPKK